MSLKNIAFMHYVGDRSYIRGVDILKNFCVSNFEKGVFPNIISFKILKPITRHGTWTNAFDPLTREVAARVKFRLGGGQTQEYCLLETGGIIHERCPGEKSFIENIIHLDRNSGYVSPLQPLEYFDALDFLIDGNKRLQEMSFDDEVHRKKVYIQLVYLTNLALPPLLDGQVKFIQNMEKSDGHVKYVLSTATFNNENLKESSFKLCFAHHYESDKK